MIKNNHKGHKEYTKNAKFRNPKREPSNIGKFVIGTFEFPIFPISKDQNKPIQISLKPE
jgi:hypothetical protein